MIIPDEDPDRPGDGEEDGCFDLMDNGEWDEDVDVEDESLGTSYHWNRYNQRIKATIKTTRLWFIRLSGFHINQTNPYSMVTLLENGLGIALQSLLVLVLTIIGKTREMMPCFKLPVNTKLRWDVVFMFCSCLIMMLYVASPGFFQVFYTSTCRR